MKGRPPRGDPPLLGRRLVELRRHRHLSQAALATALGLKPSLIAHYERREANPPLDTLRRIAKFFDVNVGHLVDEEEPPRRPKLRPGPPSELEQRSIAFTYLSAFDRRWILAVIDSFMASAEERRQKRRRQRDATKARKAREAKREAKANRLPS